MAHLGMLEIPAGNILKRWTMGWTMDAKGVLPAHMIEHENDKAAESSLSYRQSEFILFLEFAQKCCRSDKTFEAGKAALVQLKQEFLEHKQAKDDPVLSVCSHSASQGSNVQGMSAAAKDDTTSAAQKQRTEAGAPVKRKNLQHTQSKGAR